jgi:predicted nucleic acid-binding protein
MKKRYKLTDIPTLTGKGMFFDANVLLYIFWPTGKDKFEQEYSKIFGILVREKIQLFIDFLVISEVINSAIRIEYYKFLALSGLDKSQYNFKRYRDSNDGQTTLNEIYQVISKKVTVMFKVIGKEYTIDDIKKFLVLDKIDFNDKAIESLCNEFNLVFVTNDSDFKGSDLDILSSNYNIIQSV